MADQPRFIELCAGAGGLTLGLEQAGFEALALLEVHPMSCQTLRRNFGSDRVREVDIRLIDPRALRRAVGLRRGELDLLVAGLPCQGFSSSNSRTRTMANPLNTLYRAFGRFLSEFRPKFFLVENVLHLAFMETGAPLAGMLRSFRARGYRVHWSVLNAADYGVPQTRRRVILFGARDEDPPEWPLKSPTRVTVEEAIGDLPRGIRNGNGRDRLPYSRSMSEVSHYARRLRGNSRSVSGNEVSRNSAYVLRRYRHIGQGENWKAIPRTMLRSYTDLRRTHSGIYRRLNWRAPSGAIGNFRKNMLVHPSCARTLTVREAARLQSFPDHFSFVGSLGSRQKQVGNAVPPLLARALGQSLVRALRDGPDAPQKRSSTRLADTG